MGILVVHRGFRSKNGENRMIDFINALKICQAVEFDIRMTKDKKIIIFHDDDFSRIGQVKEQVRNLTYNEIKNIEFFKNHPESLPPLFINDFATNIANKYQMINVEIKGDSYAKKEWQQIEKELIKLKNDTKAEIIVSSFNKDALKFIANLKPNLFKKGYLIKDLSDINYQLLAKFDYLHPPISIVKKQKNVDLIKKINLPMNIWTFKDDSEVKIINDLYGKKIINSYISDNPKLNLNQ